MTDIIEFFKELFRLYPKCDCSDNADFSLVEKLSYNELYKCNKCNKCGRKHYLVHYGGGSLVNKTMKKRAYNEALKKFNKYLNKDSK